MILSERLRELRIDKKVTQKQIAESIGIDARNYRRYESGDTQPLIGITVKIAEFYDVSIDYLVGRTDNPKINK